MADLDGIIDIHVIPAWNSPGVRPTLTRSIRDAQLLQAAIAYWTVGFSLFGHALPQRVSLPDGFLCIDLHMPTDIDALAELVRNGAHVRLYCEDIATYRADGKLEPWYLLHAKMLLFWRRDKTAELWVGSHNWTNRALMGLNVESSLVVTMKDSSWLFFEAAEYLQKIKAICEVFDLAKIEFYKELQKAIEERTVPVIMVEAQAADCLSGLEITIFGTDVRDLKELGTVRRKVYLSATEATASEAEFVYPARISQAGELNSGNPAAGRIDFSPRRYAFRVGRRFPELLPKAAVTQSVMDNAKYYVTLELGEHDRNITFDYPRARRASWESIDWQQSPLLRRLGPEELSVIFRGSEPSVEVPVEIPEEQSRALTVYERRNLDELPFLTRRVKRRR